MKKRHTEGIVIDRRAFLVAAFVVLGGLLLSGTLEAAEGGLPTDNPVAYCKLPWTDQIQWANVLDVTQVPGKDILEKIANAQDRLAAQGGGVVYFPPGSYPIGDTIRLRDGVVLRGADPAPGSRAHEERYAPPSRLEFPKFVFSDQGNGTPVDTAFKGIHLAEPATASNCGVVNLDINRGHVFFEETADQAAAIQQVEDIIEDALGLNDDNGLPGHLLELELTESILIQDTENMLSTVHRRLT